MLHNDFLPLATGNIIQNSIDGSDVGDIDAMCVITADTLLADLFPVGNGALSVGNPGLVIPSGTLLFFEVTKVKGNDLQDAKNGYIAKKVAFHAKIQAGETTFPMSLLVDRSNIMLVLVFNGADHVNVSKKLYQLCSDASIVGTSVYASEVAILQWDWWLEAVEQRRVAEEQRLVAEERLLRLAQVVIRTGQVDQIEEDTGYTFEALIARFGADVLGLPPT